MEQAEILSLVERLLPVYHSDDFELVLNQMTEGEHPSARLLVKMELKRVMAPCQKSIDLRGRVQGECREYQLNGIRHWFDDVAINAYHKKVKRYGGYTEGVWEALVNTRHKYRTVNTVRPNMPYAITDPDSPFEADIVRLGYDLRRQENRLRMASQVDIERESGQIVHGVSVDLSCSGAKFKVPSAFDYRLGEVLSVSFTQIASELKDPDMAERIEYRILGVDDCYENSAVRWLRLKRLTDTDMVARAIDQFLQGDSKRAKRAKHDNQDHIIRARARGYEHGYLRHTCHLPLFFSGTELRYALLTDANQSLWQYWHDERNQQTFGTLFTRDRMSPLIQPGMRESNNFIYAFTHTHQDKKLFYSMMLPEANREQRQLFWHIGARRPSWRVYRLHMFELSQEEIQEFHHAAPELKETLNSLTHIGLLQEISNQEQSLDYLLTEKPTLPSAELNPFRHSRQIVGHPQGIYFDSSTRRSEPRFEFESPIEVLVGPGGKVKGTTKNFSSRGLQIEVPAPLPLKAGDKLPVSFLELQRYDEKVPLTEVPYSVVRISPDGFSIQLKIEDTHNSIRAINFLKRLINHNQERLSREAEQLPSHELLNTMHHQLLGRMVSLPFYVEKKDRMLQPRTVGVNTPLSALAKLFQSLGHNGRMSLEPLFKGRTNTLLATPMRPVEGAKPQFHDMYVSVLQNGKQIEKIETRLLSDFDSIEQRISFVKKAKAEGQFFALRISGIPVTEPTTQMLKEELSSLAKATLHHARNIEKEFSSLVGYGEIIDITDEVMIRLEVT